MSDLKFERKGIRTYVYLDGELLGRIERREVSNSSPRGGAYRTVHFAIPGIKHRKHGVRCYTRKEAAEWLLNQYNRQTKEAETMSNAPEGPATHSLTRDEALASEGPVFQVRAGIRHIGYYADAEVAEQIAEFYDAEVFDWTTGERI